MRYLFCLSVLRHFLRRIFFVVVLIVACVHLLLVARENYHAVIPGKLYRSAQLSYESFAEHVGDSHLRSIINLRGPNPKCMWYKKECKLSRRSRVRHYDLPIDSEMPTDAELCQLVDVLRKCPKPVLIHCESGIDRTGIAAAVAVLLLDEAATPEQACAQLGIRFGSLPWRKATARKLQFIHAYENWLEEHLFDHSAERFQQWLENHATDQRR